MGLLKWCLGVLLFTEITIYIYTHTHTFNNCMCYLLFAETLPMLGVNLFNTTTPEACDLCEIKVQQELPLALQRPSCALSPLRIGDKSAAAANFQLSNLKEGWSPLNAAVALKGTSMHEAAGATML